MFGKKISLLQFALYTLIIFALAVVSFNIIGKKSERDLHMVSGRGTNTDDNCGQNAIRLSGFKYIRPLLGSERECESLEKYSLLKNGIKAYIENEQQSGNIAAVSVYLEDCGNNDWMGIDAEDLFMPGSLLKMPTLLTYLKMAETNPDLLEKELLFNSKEFPQPPKQTFDSATIQSGRRYKVRDLIRNMLVHSDNYSTWLLNSKMNVETYKKVYAEIGIPTPVDYSYKISAKNYSKLLKVLYDGDYVSASHSEYAISLLLDCDFKNGMVKKLPPSVKVAHKFGEAGTIEFSELHESGLVYIGTAPYLLTVMTKGKNVVNQAEVISNISKMVYDQMLAMNGELLAAR